MRLLASCLMFFAVSIGIWPLHVTSAVQKQVIDDLLSEALKWSQLSRAALTRKAKLSSNHAALKEQLLYHQSQLDALRPPLYHSYREWRTEVYRNQFQLPIPDLRKDKLVPLKWIYLTEMNLMVGRWNTIYRQMTQVYQQLDLVDRSLSFTEKIVEALSQVHFELSSRGQLLTRVLGGKPSQYAEGLDQLEKYLSLSGSTGRQSGDLMLPVLSAGLNANYVQGSYYVSFLMDPSEPIAAVTSGNLSYNKEKGVVTLRTESQESFLYKGVGQVVKASGDWVEKGEIIAFAPVHEQKVLRLVILKQNEEGLITALQKSAFLAEQKDIY